MSKKKKKKSTNTKNKNKDKVEKKTSDDKGKVIDGEEVEKKEGVELKDPKGKASDYKNDSIKRIGDAAEEKKKNIQFIILIVAVSSFFALLAFVTANKDIINDSLEEKDELGVLDSPESSIESTIDSNDPIYYDGSIELSDIMNNGKPSLVAFGNKSCIYCEEYKPVLSKMNKEYGDQINIYYVDIDDFSDVAFDWPVHLTPSTVLTGADGKAIKVNESIFTEYGVDLFNPSGEVDLESDENVSAFFGYKDFGDLKRIVDDLLITTID